jgi:hypothetical protein
MKFRVRIEFVKEDCWIGLFWKRHRFNSSPSGVDPTITFYVCIIPMLPIIIEKY